MLDGMSSGAQDQPETVTLAELDARLALMPAVEAAAVRARIRVVDPPKSAAPTADVPNPLYASWSAYVAGTTESQRRTWCSQKARPREQGRLMLGRPAERIGWQDVLVGAGERAGAVFGLVATLAVEGRPYKPNGAPGTLGSM